MTPSAIRCVPIASALLLLVGLAPPTPAQVFGYAIEGTGTRDTLGSALSRIGDVDQDGCDDFIAGAFEAGSDDGAAVVFSGKTGAQIVRLTGNINSRFGTAVDGKIDADSDGSPDVLIGAPFDASSAHDGGRVVVYSPHLDLILHDLFCSTPYAHFGASVRALQGDVDGDGIDDFVVGMSGLDAASVRSGATGAEIFSVSGQSGSNFGLSVSQAGDLDGDGTVDFAVGSPDFINSSGKLTGRVTACSGHDGSKIWTVNGADGSWFGYSLAHPGDLDGDGIGDLVVGAPQHLDPNGILTGCATVLSGASASVLYKVFGDLAGDEFGWAVRSVGGDIDDDGTKDFIVGAPQLGASAVGFARTISGAAGTTLTTFTERSSDPTVASLYGWAVTGGDFDGDGRTDVVIGGAFFDSGRGNVETWTTAVAGWRNYDSGWAGALGIPTFTARNVPAVGQPLDLDLANSAGATTSGLLLIGVGKASMLTGKGGTLLVAPLLIVPLSIPTGGLTFSGGVPNDPLLYGFHVYLQALELDAGASKGLSFTAGLDLAFGFP